MSELSEKASMRTVAEYFPDIVIYHDPCMDGYGSVNVVKLAIDLAHATRRASNPYTLKPMVRTFGYNYQEAFGFDLETLRDKHILFVDVSPRSLNLLQKVIGLAKSVTIIDHHETARATVTSLTEKTELSKWFTDQPWHDRRGLYYKIDVDGPSGALATMNHFIGYWQNMETSHWVTNPALQLDSPSVQIKILEVSELVRHISDYDTYTFAMADTKPLAAFLRTYPLDDPASWEKMVYEVNSNREQSIAIGYGILSKMQADSREIIAAACCYNKINTQDGEVILALVNAPHTLVNTMADMICGEPTLPCTNRTVMAAYYVDKTGTFRWSLRKHKQAIPNLSLATLAKLLGGGGGHASAAGTRSHRLFPLSSNEPAGEVTWENAIQEAFA